MRQSVLCEGMFSFEVRYVAYGTIGWMRFDNNEIRQCKCVGVEWVESKNNNTYPRHKWQVAGLAEFVYGADGSSCRTTAGCVYKTEKDAKMDNYNGKIGFNAQSSIYEATHGKYGLTKDNIRKCGSFSDWLELSLYCIKSNNTIATTSCTDMDIVVDEKGFTVNLPQVERGERFVTKEDAYNAMRPFKTFSFNNETSAPPKSEKVRITVEIDRERLNELRDFCNVISEE